MPAKDYLEIDGRRVTVTNLNKILYPGGRFTKAKVVDYYIRVAKFLLPHLKDRPVTLKRFPNGVYGEFFYEKHAPSFTPDWVKTFPVPRRETPGPPIRYILIDDLPTLVWLANLANLEIHPFLHRAPTIHRPTWLVFDLDPGEGADVLMCARVAFILRDLLGQLELESLVKVSGSKGLQVYVPLNTPVTYEQTRPFAKAIAELLAEREPSLIVSKMPKVFRAKKVFIDWSQNDDYKTTVGVYSLRAKTYRPYVSMPVEWDELKRALDKNDKDELYFTPEEALADLEIRGDIFKDVLLKKQKLPKDLLAQGAKRDTQPSVSDDSKTKKNTIRRSRQGGRRRFALVNNQTRGRLLLEMNERVRVWSMRGGLPNKGQTRTARPEDDLPVDRLESKSIKPQAELGTYDLVEGSYEDGLLRVHLDGGKSRGEWTLSLDTNGKTWKVSRDS